MTDAPPSATAYYEPAARYTSAGVLAAFVAVGLLIDSVRAGRLVHLLGWVIAGGLLVGINVLVVHAARTMRSITVTADQIRVGEQWLERAHVASLDDTDDSGHVLGQTPHTSLPRGVPGLRLRLVDGAVAVVPTRHPQRLATVLALRLPDRVDDVRPASAADFDLAAEIDARAATLYRIAGIDAPDPVSADQLRAADVVLVCGTPPVGFVAAGRDGDAARISALAVVPPRMRQGVGSALVGELASWARTRGIVALTATAREDVPWQDAFFGACGFAPDGDGRRLDVSAAPSG